MSIKLPYSNNKPRPDLIFSQQPGLMLMKQCDKAAKRKHKESIDANRGCEIKHAEIETPIVKNKIKDESTNVLAREIDAKTNELEAKKS